MLHFDNKGLKPLKSFYLSYLKKGLAAYSSESRQFDGTIKEKYAHDICARIHEIDNAFESLSLSVEYLRKTNFTNSEYSFSTHHSFHFENFLLRLTSVVDRCYKVAGTSILLKRKAIESNDGNRYVLRELKLYSVGAVQAIENINSVVKPLRKSRNQIAHQAGYSNKNLNSLNMMFNIEEPELLQEIENIMSIDDLRSLVIQDTLNLLEPIVEKLHCEVSQLVESLSFIYQDIVDIEGLE